MDQGLHIPMFWMDIDVHDVKTWLQVYESVIACSLQERKRGFILFGTVRWAWCHT